MTYMPLGPDLSHECRTISHSVRLYAQTCFAREEADSEGLDRLIWSLLRLGYVRIGETTDEGGAQRTYTITVLAPPTADQS